MARVESGKLRLVRPGFKLVLAIGTVAALGALLGGPTGKLSRGRWIHLSGSIPSGHAELKGDLEKPSDSRVRLIHESLPAVAGDEVRIPDSGTESECLSRISYLRGAERLPFSLYQRPPPA
jgi:hypothetical protein